ALAAEAEIRDTPSRRSGCGGLQAQACQGKRRERGAPLHSIPEARRLHSGGVVVRHPLERALRAFHGIDDVSARKPDVLEALVGPGLQFAHEAARAPGAERVLPALPEAPETETGFRAEPAPAARRREGKVRG